MDARGPFDFDLSRMSVDEVKERLRAAGIPVDTWVDNEQVVQGGQSAPLPTLARYAELLTRLKSLLEEQQAKDLKQIDELNCQLRRLEHGGGR